jgi:glycosyltransferase involved in cell wall biosynthesis
VSRTLLISAVMTLRNGMRLGYPFVEAILSVLPLCDEFVIVEGCGDDETWDWLERLQRKFPDKIVLSRERWPDGLRSGHAIGLMQTAALKQCRGKWVFLVQADEILPEENVRYLRELCDPMLLLRRVRQTRSAPPAHGPDTVHLPVPPDTEADARDRRYSRDLAYMRKQDALVSLLAGSYHLDFVHWVGVQGALHFQHLSYRWATRLARNRPGLYSGSDGWLLQGPGCFPMATARMPHPIIHLPATFPVNGWRKVINHAALYPDLATLQEQAQEAQARLNEYADGILPPAQSAPPFRLPALIAPLIGQPEYRVRPELLE